MADRQAKWSEMMGKLELTELDGLTELNSLIEETADREVLERIRALAFKKAGLPQEDAHPAKKPAPKRLRWPLRLLVAALALFGAMMTAFATTDLGYYLEDQFGEDFAFLSRLRVIGGYGSPIDAQATDQGISISVEAAYSDEAGTMLVLSLEDAQGRLSGKSDLYGSFEQGGYTDFSSSTTLGERQGDGKVYALIDITSAAPLKGRNTRYTVHWIAEEDRHVENIPVDVDIMEHVRIYQEPVWEEDESGAPARVAGGGSMHIPVPALEGLVLTDLCISEEKGFSVYGYYPSLDEKVRRHSFSLSLRTPGGTVIDANSWSSSGNDPSVRTAEISFSAHFNRFTTPKTLEGYTLVLEYFEDVDKIYGEWPLEFRMPQETAAKRIKIGNEVQLGKARYRVDEVLITPGAAIISTVHIDGPSEQYVEYLPGVWYPQRLDVTLVDAKGDRMDEGHFSFFYEGNIMRTIFNYHGALEGASLVAMDSSTQEELLRVPLE